jgi:hypothetical protein
MKAARRWLLVAVIPLTVGQGLAPASSAKPPAATALVGWAAGFRGKGSVGVVGGIVAGKGWVGGEQAKGVMRKGDRLSVYGLQSGLVGTAWLTNDGTLASAGPPGGGSFEGLEYTLKTQPAPGKEGAWGRDRLIAVWHAPHSPRPRWVRATILSPKSATYRNLVAGWLRDRGLPKEAIDGVTLHEVVRADLNGDGRDEVLLSFYSANVYENPLEARAYKPFSYLLLRYLPRGSRAARTVVVEGAGDTKREILGLCDLDGDGWAEIVTQGLGLEQEDAYLNHWTGREFRATRGYAWGV